MVMHGARTLNSTTGTMSGAGAGWRARYDLILLTRIIFHWASDFSVIDVYVSLNIAMSRLRKSTRAMSK